MGEPTEKTEEFFENTRKEVKELFGTQTTQIDQIFDQIKGWYLAPQGRVVPTIVNLYGPLDSIKAEIIQVILNRLQISSIYENLKDYRVNGVKLSENLTQQFVRNVNLTDAISVSVSNLPDDLALIFDDFQDSFLIDQNGRLIENPAIDAFWNIIGLNHKVSIVNPSYPIIEFLAKEPSLNDERMQFLLKDIPEEKREEAFNEFIKIAKTITSQARDPFNVDFSKSLIFVTGKWDTFLGNMINAFYNLEFYTIEEIHKNSLKISSELIKKELSIVLSPTKIKMLGNNFVIFPTFSSSEYKNVIHTKLEMLCAYASQNLNMDLTFTDRFLKRIYEEGVNPLQTMKFLIITINEFTESPLNNIFYEITKLGFNKDNHARITVDITPKGRESIWDIETKEGGFIRKFNVSHDSIETLTPHKGDEKYLVAAHEAGHATVYIATRLSLPKQIRSNTRGKEIGGFVLASDKNEIIFKNDFIEKISFMLGGLVAEEIVFHDITKGPTFDLEIANGVAGEMVKNYAMGKARRFLVDSINETDIKMSSDEIEKILDEAYKKANELLKKEVGFWKALSKELLARTSISKRLLTKLLREHWTEKNEVEKIIKGTGAPTRCKNLFYEFINKKKIN